MMKKKIEKIGFFGGTFDPIHLGHVSLAIQLKEHFSLDQVIFCPTWISPHKIDQAPFASGKDRLAMVELAIQGIHGFSCTDMEIQRKKVSFTIETIKLLTTKFEEEKRCVDLHLLLGEDSLEKFSTWKEVDALVQLAPPLIGGRTAALESLIKTFPKEWAHLIEKNLVPIQKMDISATEIRKRIQGGVYCGHLLPYWVEEYIQKNGLYREIFL
jgi:nicotinate-nucleotide adenylyltransferase